MSAPILRLVCPQCDWAPDEEINVALVAAHMQTEHGAAEEDSSIKLDMRAFCPRDDTYLVDPYIRHLPNGKTLIDHTCSKCKRTYTVTQRAEGQS